MPMGTWFILSMSWGPAMMYPALQPVQAKVLLKLISTIVLSSIPGLSMMGTCPPSQMNSV